MSEKLPHKLVVSISSRALFNLDESHQIYEQEGVDAYANYQIAHENDILEPGPAFPMAKKLLRLNEDHEQPLVEIVLLSRNSADTGLRIFNAIQHYDLKMTRAAFTSGRSPFDYVKAFNTHLFLSADPLDVRKALDENLAAAAILPSTSRADEHPELRIAFDGDAVIFSDESERIYQEQSLEAFNANEIKEAKKPMSGGPFKNFLETLSAIHRLYPAETSPIRTALVTARSAPAHERVIRTLRAWDIRIDEALFLGGLGKGEFLKAFGADIFFDDQQVHCDSARAHVATGHVPSGVVNHR
jgi:5'-nucleotidase